MRARLVCRVRPGTTQSFDVAGEAMLGRDPGQGVALPLDGVSRLHARLLSDGKAFWLEDLKSTNGTFLNGAPLLEREKLRHLDVISLGRKVDLLFLLREGEAPARRQLGIVRAALVREGSESVPYEVPMGEARLGRSPACNLQIEASAVSKFHARIERGLERVTIVDEGSANGTFVNGLRVEQPLALHQGDVISLGGAESLRVVIEQGEVTAMPGAVTTPAREGEPVQQWNAEWRTRLEWSTSELAALQEMREEPGTILRHSRPEPPTVMRKPGEGPTVTRRPQPSAPPTGAGPAPAASRATVADAPGRAPVVPPKTPPPPAPQATPGAAARKTAAAVPPTPVVPPIAPVAAQAPVVAPVPAAEIAQTRASPRQQPPEPPPRASVIAIRLVAPDLDVTLREAGSWELGRSRDTAIRIDNPTVSRRHARLTVSADLALTVEDLGAANGTFVGDQRLAPQTSRAVADGDVLRLGDVRVAVTMVRG